LIQVLPKPKDYNTLCADCLLVKAVRPIYVALAFFIIGIVGYLGVNVYFEMMSLQTALIYSFAAIALGSLPIGAALEIARWRREQAKKNPPKP